MSWKTPEKKANQLFYLKARKPTGFKSRGNTWLELFSAPFGLRGMAVLNLGMEKILTWKILLPLLLTSI